jgi:hypothetical protein
MELLLFQARFYALAAMLCDSDEDIRRLHVAVRACGRLGACG